MQTLAARQSAPSSGPLSLQESKEPPSASSSLTAAFALPLDPSAAACSSVGIPPNKGASTDLGPSVKRPRLATADVATNESLLLRAPGSIDSAFSSPELAAAKASRDLSATVAELPGPAPASALSSAAAAEPLRPLVATPVAPGSFDESRCYYQRVLNAHVHPIVAAFIQMSNQRRALRYCSLHPAADYHKLMNILESTASLFRWSGADLFSVTNAQGNRQMIVIECNSCPSGQKSMPIPHPDGSHSGESDSHHGYHRLMKHAMLPAIRERAAAGTLPVGALAVVYDKNEMEAVGYAGAMADEAGETVYLCKLPPAADSTGTGASVSTGSGAGASSAADGGAAGGASAGAEPAESPVRWVSGVMHLRTQHTVVPAAGPGAAPAGSVSETWVPIRAAFRYVTQKPWARIPLSSRTLIVNPIIACLAGGRNKMAADKAYEFLNKELAEAGLAVRVPETIRDVAKEEVPLWVRSMGGKAVVKVPYSNAGQGVYTILTEAELTAFMARPGHYDKYVVQALVGHREWSSSTVKGTYYHTGTVPNAKLKTYVSDLRVMVCSSPSGFLPLAVYARRAERPLEGAAALAQQHGGDVDSWRMLGTNLSVKKEDGSWDTDTSRLLLMDHKDFNRLGLGLDDLIDAYVQTVLATTAIDRLASRIVRLPCAAAASTPVAATTTLTRLAAGPVVAGAGAGATSAAGTAAGSVGAGAGAGAVADDTAAAAVGTFDFDLFSSINADSALLHEILL